MKLVPLNNIFYDGSQLRHLFAYNASNGLMVGDSIAYFKGGCKVQTHLVDAEDVLNDDYISSKEMLHFIVEIFDVSTTEAVLWQRTLIHLIIEELRRFLLSKNDCLVWPHIAKRYQTIDRLGDDIMVLDDDGETYPQPVYKLSVSIATKSCFSGLIHVGLNIDVGDNCPVKAIGLKDIGIKDIDTFMHNIANHFVGEFNSIKHASYKVKGVE